MFPQVSVANVENAHHSTRQWLFLSELKRKEEPRKHSTRKRRFLQTTCPDHPEEHLGNKEPARNPQRQRGHLSAHAGQRWGDGAMGCSDGVMGCSDWLMGCTDGVE